MKSLARQVLPVWHAIKRDGVNAAMRQLKETQWLQESELLSLQEAKLERLLRFAGTYVPYYRDAFKKSSPITEAGLSRDAFRDVPLLTKAIIRSEPDRLVSENLSGNSLIPNSTSGSTGQAIKFFTDTRSVAYRTAAEMRSNEFTGWQFGERWVTLWGAPMDMERGRALRSRLRGIVNRRIFLSSFDLSPERLDQYLDQMDRFRPVLIVGYPGPLEQLALHCRANNVRIPSLRAIVSSAETLWPHQREIIESVLGVKVYNRYGTREIGQMCGECEFHSGMHVSVERVLIEIVNDEDRACEPGEIGRILVTDLDNFGMPLIRYDIGDHAIPAESQVCPCGRGLPKIEKIEGRTLEVVRTPEGRRVGGTFWTLLLRSRPGLKQFQVVQNRLEGISVNYVRDSDVPAPDFDYFRQKIAETCGENFKIDFVEKDRIDLTSAGKQRLIISDVSSSTHQSDVVIEKRT